MRSLNVFGWLMAAVVVGSVMYALGSVGFVHSDFDNVYEHGQICSIITKDNIVFPLQHQRQAEKCEYNELALTKPMLTGVVIQRESNFIYVKPGRSNYYQGPLTKKIYIVTDKFKATLTTLGPVTETISAFPFPIKYGYNEQLEFNLNQLKSSYDNAYITVIPLNYAGLEGDPIKLPLK